MTREEIIKLGRKLGLRPDIYSNPGVVSLLKHAVYTEREACAKFFDNNDALMFWGSQAASHIRARSNHD